MKNIGEMCCLPLRPWVAKKVGSGNDDYDVCETLKDDMLYPMNLDVSRDAAMLISAAPELYEALRQVYESANDLQADHSSKHIDGGEICEDCMFTVAWLKKARAALEKAGGAE